MIRNLLPVLLLLSLTACGTTSVRDDSPASDLDALEANVRKDAAKVTLPNGKIYCGELARTTNEQEDCIGDLEDALFNVNNGRFPSILATVQRFIRGERLRRNPCSWWQRTVSDRARCAGSATR